MENKIKKFTSDKKNKNSYLISRKIFKNVIDLSNTETSNLILNSFSNIFDMPKGVLRVKYKKHDLLYH